MASAVEEVVRRLVKAGGAAGSGDEWRVVVDCDLKAMGQFFRDEQEGRHRRCLFVRSGLGGVTLEPWVALVEGLVGRDRGMMDGGAIVDARGGGGRDVVEAALGRMGRVAAADDEGAALWIREEISSAEQMNEVRAELVKLGRLEDRAIEAYDRRFSRLIGGCSPVVVVLDDYNNFVKKVDGVFCVDEERWVGEGGWRDNFEGYLKCHCATLNNLGIVFSVEAPAVRMEERSAGMYAAVSEVLPFDFLDACRDRVGAIMVDLEWRRRSGGDRRVGEGGAEGLRGPGLAALRLVTTRYPEVPAFVYTGQWSERGLLEGLVHGASWCFQKRRSHHPPYIGKEGKALRSLALEEHLTKAVEMRCGAYGDSPDGEQLPLDSSEAGVELRDGLGIGSRAGDGEAGAELQRLVASLFPGASAVRPERVVRSGRSRGLVGAFVAKVGGSQGEGARRFVKVGSWAGVVGEWMAWRRVIAPRVSSQVAQVVGGPVMVEGVGLRRGGRREFKGALAYGLVGFPALGELRSLGDRLGERRPGGGEGR